MIQRARAGPVTFGEFVEVIQDDEKADLIDGVIHVASPENIEHNDLVSWLTTILRLFVEQCRLGRVMVNKVAFRLADKTAPEPDVAFVRAGRERIIKPGYVDGPPDLAIEIVSPDSAERDYGEKRVRYETAQVLEYWIIDPEQRRATFYGLEPTGFVDLQPVEHVFRSRVLPGFALDTRWLWQRPLPDTLPIVQGLLESAK